MVKITLEEDYQRLCCGSCGIVYFFSKGWCDRARERGTEWKCPNGHGQWFGEGENDRLRRERDQLKQQMARVEDEKREAQKDAAAQVTARLKAERATKRLRARAQGGACPDCNRTFVNMTRHMATKHPQKPRLVCA